jgi:[protein-PII] uridylyltransferase
MPGAPARVTFDASSDQAPALLTVEAVDRPGLLLAITQALFRAGVQIVTSDATTHEGRVVDRFTLVEADGTPIGRQRRVTVQAEVLSAIEALLRLTSKRRSTRPPKPRSRP